MAQQQQQRRDDFTTQECNHGGDDDQKKAEQFGTGGVAAVSDVTQYTYYETTVATRYGAPPVAGVPAGAFAAMPNYGTISGAAAYYDPAAYGTAGFAGVGAGTGGGGGGGQWGQEANMDGGGGGGGGQWGQDAPTRGESGGGGDDN
ncbi:hypothetical protein RIF29_35555 [Crotalaria pallida]|uniref:Uncharacterized protein n=1 Tax=Crotalaria pallida TaxID=3830 RepID=A0AAN9EA30_CROPI